MFEIRYLFKSAIVLTAAGLLGSFTATDGFELVKTARADEPSSDVATPKVHTRDLCGPVGPGQMRCLAKVVTDENGTDSLTAGPTGLGPPDLVSAYKLPASGGNGRTIAIVDAQDAPNAEKDMGTYRTQYGLPACTTANGCFKKVNQTGAASPLPTSDSGWAGEIALDLDMASAICPDCKILLIEADSANTPDLGTAVNTAATMGAAAISNSYGGPEDTTVTTVSAQYYKHPGILVTVSSGDTGNELEFPASSEFVLAVGGTSLKKSTSGTRGWTETAWSSGGSGCSAHITKPTWQKDTACKFRSVADVSAVGDPQTGVAVFNGSWMQVGGTSASSPIVASIFTLLGLNGVDTSYPYSNPGSFYDVTSGTNGSCGNILCTAGTGWDGPTGIGSPNGSMLTGGDGGGGSTGTSDAGTGDSGTKTDSGTATDSGTGSDVGTADTGTVDTGTPDTGTKIDSGTPFDSGSPTPVDSGTTTPVDSSTPVDSGNTTTTKPDTGTINPDTGTTSDSGCGCSVPGSSTRLGNSGLMGLGIAGLMVLSRRRRRGASRNV